jgi:aldose 1-epimerase
MVPWAGRIRDGRFDFRGDSYELPRNLPPHAIHGIGFERPWTVLGKDRVGIDLTAPWPFGGHATQTFAITDVSLRMTLIVEARARDMPVVLGWHPCLRRVLTRGAPAELTFDPKWMWHRAPDGVPDGTRVAPSAGPWDDSFGGVTTAPIIRWPGAIQLSLETDCPAWIVYTERSDQICVEPQTGIPNAFNLDEPRVLAGGESMELALTLRWASDQ